MFETEASRNILGDCFMLTLLGLDYPTVVVMDNVTTQWNDSMLLIHVIRDKRRRSSIFLLILVFEVKRTFPRCKVHANKCTVAMRPCLQSE